MNGIGVVKTALNSTRDLLNWYLGDLSDQDLLHHPAPGANNIAWQMGHLIQAEPGLLRPQFPDAVYPDLPAGFAAQHGKATHDQDAPTGFASKATYVELSTKTRQATLALLDKLSDADLDRATVGSMATFAPTLGAMFLLVSNHSLMHAGQFSVVRRKLGKPVLF